MKRNGLFFLYFFVTGTVLLLLGYGLFCLISRINPLADLYWKYEPEYPFQYFSLLGLLYALPYLFLGNRIGRMHKPASRVAACFGLLILSVFLFLLAGPILFNIHDKYKISSDWIARVFSDTVGYWFFYVYNYGRLFRLMAAVIIPWVLLGAGNIFPAVWIIRKIMKEA